MRRPSNTLAFDLSSHLLASPSKEVEEANPSTMGAQGRAGYRICLFHAENLGSIWKASGLRSTQPSSNAILGVVFDSNA